MNLKAWLPDTHNGVNLSQGVGQVSETSHYALHLVALPIAICSWNSQEYIIFQTSTQWHLSLWWQPQRIGWLKAKFWQSEIDWFESHGLGNLG